MLVEVKVIRETEHTLVIETAVPWMGFSDLQETKVYKQPSYFRTIGEAVQSRQDLLQKRVNRAQKKLGEAEARLSMFFQAYGGVDENTEPQQ